MICTVCKRISDDRVCGKCKESIMASISALEKLQMETALYKKTVQECKHYCSAPLRGEVEKLLLNAYKFNSIMLEAINEILKLLKNELSG